MEFIGVRDFRSKSAGIWKKLAKQKEMVITSNGKPVAVLSAVGQQDLESSLKALRRAKAIVAFESLQKQAVKSGNSRVTLQEVNKEIHRIRHKPSDIL